MNGVVVVRSLLAASNAVTSLVPSERIQAGVLPQGTALPSISVEQVSGNDVNMIDEGAMRHVNDRVQVTVLAGNYPTQRAILSAVKRACASKFPTVNGIENVTVHSEGTGPDFMNETASIYMGSHDFRVRYNEPT